MDIKKITQSLHPYERRVLPELTQHSYVKDLSTATGLQEVEVMRALQWLENKKAVTIETEPQEIITLDKNGENYLKEGLPERKFLITLQEKEIPLGKLADKTKLSKEEVNICVGLLRQKGAIILLKNKELVVKITDKGKQILKKEFLEENFLKKTFPLNLKELSPEEKHVFDQLKKRKQIIKIEQKKIKKAKLTETGKKLISMGVRDEKFLDKITPQVLRTGEWKNKTFRRYDVTINVPAVSGGKKQSYRAFLDWVRQKFMAIGFEEMNGPLVETEFWNMDTLYMPQFHSARDIHDAYYIKEPKYGTVEEKLVKKVQATHENGNETGSTGWKYNFDPQRTLRHVLRTQGTACSSRMLASKELKIPGKYFGITRVFRHDVIDATHLPDFNQTEGIVVEEGLTFRHLVGLLKMFAKEFADTEEIRIVPGYFPFTEPSAELFAKHPQLGWIELGGAGIFRPEVVMPLVGKNISVCAWGLGIDRIGMFKLGLKDIRELFSQDLNFLRNTPVI
ncbi:phenylalanine--tRNA ligase subunit alpha [Candidatus Woesearchaeota archaeon]|nr:phenylalanine--tRNA ligase subunit alpha [Candidatus Woesearchaeota archaeon]